MNQEELKQRYLEKMKDVQIDFSTAARYFKSGYRFFQDLQEGVANPTNFFDETIALFEEVDKPKREADFVSMSGSRYWHLKDGVIRGSNHWGNHIVNCDWAFKQKNGKTIYGHSAWAAKTLPEERFGYARWDSFVLKPRIIDINGQEVLTTHENKIGRDQIKVGDHQYQLKFYWEEVM